MKIQYFGHSTFKLTSGDTTILVDPFFTGNPAFTGELDVAIEGAQAIALTHGHNDHYGDTEAIVAQLGIPVIAMFELAGYAAKRTGGEARGFGMGGTQTFGDFEISLVRADHSGSITDPEGNVHYTGGAAGLIISDGKDTVYHMGDTAVFGDMALINEMYKPTIGLVPMGGLFTMDAQGAALACNRFFDFETIIPIHYNSFPPLAKSADELASLITKGKVREIASGDVFDS